MDCLPAFEIIDLCCFFFHVLIESKICLLFHIVFTLELHFIFAAVSQEKKNTSKIQMNSKWRTEINTRKTHSENKYTKLYQPEAHVINLSKIKRTGWLTITQLICTILVRMFRSNRKKERKKEQATRFVCIQNKAYSTHEECVFVEDGVAVQCKPKTSPFRLVDDGRKCVWALDASEPYVHNKWHTEKKENNCYVYLYCIFFAKGVKKHTYTQASG